MSIHEHFKKDFNIDLSDDLEWGVEEFFFWVNDYIYYHKPTLKQKIQVDIRWLIADRKNKDKNSISTNHGNQLPGWTGRSCGQQSIEQVKRVINVAPEGMPKFIKETEHFFVFEMATRKHITIADMTPELIDKIENSFGNTFGPYYNNMAYGMYDGGDKVYWTMLNSWAHYTADLRIKGGVYMKENESDEVHLFMHVVPDEDMKVQIELIKVWEFGKEPKLIIHDKQ
jgi:hypothetical protein